MIELGGVTVLSGAVSEHEISAEVTEVVDHLVVCVRSSSDRSTVRVDRDASGNGMWSDRKCGRHGRVVRPVGLSALGDC